MQTGYVFVNRLLEISLQFMSFTRVCMEGPLIDQVMVIVRREYVQWEELPLLNCLMEAHLYYLWKDSTVGTHVVIGLDCVNST